MSKQELRAMLEEVVGEFLAKQKTASAKPAQVSKGGKDMTKKDAALKAQFTRRGIKDVSLMDRNDPKKDFNVKSYRLWLESGRQVRKGEKSVRGLFHITQTDPITETKAPAPAAQTNADKPTLHLN